MTPVSRKPPSPPLTPPPIGTRDDVLAFLIPDGRWTRVPVALAPPVVLADLAGEGIIEPHETAIGWWRLVHPKEMPCPVA